MTTPHKLFLLKPFTARKLCFILIIDGPLLGKPVTKCSVLSIWAMSSVICWNVVREGGWQNLEGTRNQDTVVQWVEHWWLVYHGCFELVLASLGTKSHSCRFGIIRVIFFFVLKMVYCVYSLESRWWGDSNENTQHTFMLKKIEEIPLGITPPYLALWWTRISSNYPCLEHISWSQRCSSHWSSTVVIVMNSKRLISLCTEAIWSEF